MVQFLWLCKFWNFQKHLESGQTFSYLEGFELQLRIHALFCLWNVKIIKFLLSGLCSLDPWVDLFWLRTTSGVDFFWFERQEFVLLFNPLLLKIPNNEKLKPHVFYTIQVKFWTSLTFSVTNNHFKSFNKLKTKSILSKMMIVVMFWPCKNSFGRWIFSSYRVFVM